MALFLPFLELHESDVQMPLEKLWEGAEYSGRHPEAHPDGSPWVRRPPSGPGGGSPGAAWAPPEPRGACTVHPAPRALDVLNREAVR